MRVEKILAWWDKFDDENTIESVKARARDLKREYQEELRRHKFDDQDFK